MNNFFENFYNYAGFGPAIKSVNVDNNVINKYQGKLPARLIEYWQEYGFCGWGDGAFWTVNPDNYTDILSAWLQDTEFEKRVFEGIDIYHVIGVGAFGRLFIWGENSGQSIKINTNFGMILPSDKTADLMKKGGDRLVDSFYSCMTKSAVEEEDLNGKSLFDRAKNKLGTLANDEMYGFVPALALGGEPKLENLQIVKKLEHLSFLADLGDKKVMADIVALSKTLPPE
jgi:hypothetical protein